MNRNLDEVRRKNLLGKREIHGKPPSAFKKPSITKVFILFYLSFFYCSCLFSQQLMNDIVQLMMNKLF